MPDAEFKKNLSFYINWQGPAAAICFAGQMKREELRAQMAQSHLKTPSLFQGYQLTIKIKTSFKTLLNMYVCVLNYARKKEFYLQFYFELKNCFHPIQTILCGNIIYIYVIAYANLQLNQISSLGGIEFFVFDFDVFGNLIARSTSCRETLFKKSLLQF